MAEVSAGIAAQLALTQQAIALQMIRQNAEMQQAIVEMIAQTVVPAGSRGGAVNISA